MGKFNIEDNIQRTFTALENTTKEMYRLEGMLRVFQQLKDAGVTEIDVKEEDSHTDQTVSP
jgi:hypothetical protein